MNNVEQEWKTVIKFLSSSLSPELTEQFLVIDVLAAKDKYTDSGVGRITQLTLAKLLNKSSFGMCETQERYPASSLVPPPRSFDYFPCAMPCLLYEKYSHQKRIRYTLIENY